MQVASHTFFKLFQSYRSTTHTFKQKTMGKSVQNLLISSVHMYFDDCGPAPFLIRFQTREDEEKKKRKKPSPTISNVITEFKPLSQISFPCIGPIFVFVLLMKFKGSPCKIQFIYLVVSNNVS